VHDERDRLGLGLPPRPRDRPPVLMSAADVRELVHQDVHPLRQWIARVDVDDPVGVTGVPATAALLSVGGKPVAVAGDERGEDVPVSARAERYISDLTRRDPAGVGRA